MEKINIAELLKDCPKGMELDCTMFDNVTLDRVVIFDNYPIKIKISEKEITLNKYGQYFDHGFSKCVIFPKGKTTWEGFHRPFKDGDIITCTNSCCTFVSIFKERMDENLFVRYCAFILDDNELKVNTAWSDFEKPRLATEEEKQKLFDAIKANGYKWNEETKKLEKVSQYPQTLEKCCAILGLTELGFIGGYRRGLLTQFRNLLICRDAYWKIAGEEMGLGIPWEPDWKNSEERRYCIVNIEGDINLPEKILIRWILKVTNKILVFPTEEMRDAFYEHFEELIKECKSLL